MDSFALITGSSSGIGLEIAKSLAKRGHNLILTARREALLEKYAKEISNNFNVKVKFIAVDLGLTGAPQEIFEFCKNNNYFVNILVNNAGYGIKTPFHETSIEDEENFIRVLGTSVIMTTKLFLPMMLEKNEGKIMIVSSVAAFAAPSAIQALYGPIKTFMNRFSDSINVNYNHKGITSTAVCPGYTVTNFHTASGVQEEMDSVPTFLKKSAKRIALEGVDAMLKGKKVSVPTKTWKIIVFLLKIIPHSVFGLVSGLLAPGRYDEI